MLILVGVTVSIAINGGLFGMAKKSVTQTQLAMDREELQEAVVTEYINGSGVVDYNELKNKLSNWNIDTVTGKATSPNGNVFKIYKNGEFVDSTEADISDFIKVGDYVNYEPQSELKTYKLEGKYSGYVDSDGNYANQDISQDNLRWRIFNINEDGTIDLISETRTKSTMTLNGALAYNNGVYLLNDYCNKIYSNNLYQATARSINIDDIKNKLQNFNCSDTIKTYYAADNKSYYPYQWSQEILSKENKIDGKTITDGKIGQSEQYELTERTYEIANNSIVVQNTFWSIGLNENKLKTIATRDSDMDSKMYHNLLIDKDTSYTTFYWVASRYVCTSSDFADFGLWYVHSFEDNEILRGDGVFSL